MLQFDAPRCRIESNVAYKVRRYIYLFVAPGGVISTKRSITLPKELACPMESYSTGVSDVGWRKAITVLTEHRVRLGLRKFIPAYKAGQPSRFS